jgi:hypothetical protein
MLFVQMVDIRIISFCFLLKINKILLTVLITVVTVVNFTTVFLPLAL